MATLEWRDEAPVGQWEGAGRDAARKIVSELGRSPGSSRSLVPEGMSVEAPRPVAGHYQGSDRVPSSQESVPGNEARAAALDVKVEAGAASRGVPFDRFSAGLRQAYGARGLMLAKPDRGDTHDRQMAQIASASAEDLMFVRDRNASEMKRLTIKEYAIMAGFMFDRRPDLLQKARETNPGRSDVDLRVNVAHWMDGKRFDFGAGPSSARAYVGRQTDVAAQDVPGLDITDRGLMSALKRGHSAIRSEIAGREVEAGGSLSGTTIPVRDGVERRGDLADIGGGVVARPAQRSGPRAGGRVGGLGD